MTKTKKKYHMPHKEQKSLFDSMTGEPTSKELKEKLGNQVKQVVYEQLTEHTQKMIKSTAIEDTHEPKADERWCTQCEMMWLLVNIDGTKNFTPKSTICNKCIKQNLCEHERTFKSRGMIECEFCQLRREPSQVKKK